MTSIANRLVRAYLYHCPVTEGKSSLLRAFEETIVPRSSPVISETKDGFRMVLNLSNPEHRRIYFYGEHDERYELRLLRRVVRGGDVCWDIGANIGYYSCFLSRRVGAQGRVIAFEPVLETREMLQRNLELNGFSQAQVLPVALSNRKETARMYFSDASLGEGTASLHRAENMAKWQDVSLERIDALAPDLPVPSIVKIDVEGHLCEVWEGGEGFFEKQAPLILAEIKDCANASQRSALVSAIRQAGYEAFAIHKRRLSLVGDLVDFKKRNVLLSKPGSLMFERIKPFLG